MGAVTDTGCADPTVCTNAGGTYTADQFVVIGDVCTWSDVAGGEYRVYIEIAEASATECQVTVSVTHDAGACLFILPVASYRSVLLKSDSLPWTLDYLSDSGVCTWPATVTVNGVACA